MRMDGKAAAPLRILYFGTYRANYSRNQIMIACLRQNGVEVIECHETLWHGIEDRVQLASGGWMNLSFVLRVMRAYTRLVVRYLSIRDYDIMVVGYPGQFDVFLARLLSWLKHRPLVWDVFMSIYLIAVERGLDRKSAFTTRMLFYLEKIALRLPDRLVQDTAEYVDWLCKTFGLAPERFRLVPTGADDRMFFPRPNHKSDAKTFEVLYYGTFIPNHGVRLMVEAARLLADEPDITFTFIGVGPERDAVRQIASGLNNIQFIDWMEKDALAVRAASADLCLGAFGHTPQSLMTVQNKIYEGLAMRMPVLTGDSPAMRKSFTHRKHLYLCERQPAALAEAVRVLYKQPELCHTLAEEGYQLYCSHYNLVRLGVQYSQHLREVYSQYNHKHSQFNQA